MTNEEIQRAAEAFFERRRGIGERIDWLAVGLLATHMRRLVSVAYEEAARAACSECAKANAPHLEGNLWMHPGDPVCAAGGIHDLKHSLLAQEPVAT